MNYKPAPQTPNHTMSQNDIPRLHLHWSGGDKDMEVLSEFMTDTLYLRSPSLNRLFLWDNSSIEFQGEVGTVVGYCVFRRK